MNALANPEVGKYLNENFVSSFQKVATFRIVGGQKAGRQRRLLLLRPGWPGAARRRRPGGRRHAAARGQMGRRDDPKGAWQRARATAPSSRPISAQAHADRLRTRDTASSVEAVTFDPPAEQDPKTAPDLQRPVGPAAGPEAAAAAHRRAGRDVPCQAGGRRHGVRRRQPRLPTARAAAGRWTTRAASTCCWPPTPWSRSRSVYGSVFENILGEKISTRPVEIVSPFPWVKEGKGG